MKRALRTIAVFVFVALLLGLGHLALIEIGREVVTLRTAPAKADAGWKTTRLWAVDHDGAVWLHSKGSDWHERFERGARVELERDGEIRRYAARFALDEHEQVDALLREKYGIADRWVRFLAPCDDEVLPVRLDPIRE